MNKIVKLVFITSLGLFLTACETDQKYKVQFEPTLPVPFVVVPDEGTTNNPNNNNYQNPPQQYTPPPQYNNHQDKHRRGNKVDKGNNYPQPDNNYQNQYQN